MGEKVVDLNTYNKLYIELLKKGGMIVEGALEDQFSMDGYLTEKGEPVLMARRNNPTQQEYGLVIDGQEAEALIAKLGLDLTPSRELTNILMEELEE